MITFIEFKESLISSLPREDESVLTTKSDLLEKMTKLIAGYDSVLYKEDIEACFSEAINEVYLRM